MDPQETGLEGGSAALHLEEVILGGTSLISGLHMSSSAAFSHVLVYSFILAIHPSTTGSLPFGVGGLVLVLGYFLILTPIAFTFSRKSRGTPQAGQSKNI